jgi:hypothetical protein
MNIKNNYITIQGWMVQELKLNGNSLLTFALIHGFTQDGNSEFTGSLKYICKWLNCSKPTAMKSLIDLSIKGYIKKDSTIVNHITFNRYMINKQKIDSILNGGKETLSEGGKETCMGGGKETLPNKDILNKDRSNKDIKEKLFENFWTMYDKKVGRETCMKKFLKLDLPVIEKILQVVPNYVVTTPDKEFRKNPETWLNNKCWNDEIILRLPPMPTNKINFKNIEKTYGEW